MSKTFDNNNNNYKLKRTSIEGIALGLAMIMLTGTVLNITNKKNSESNSYSNLPSYSQSSSSPTTSFDNTNTFFLPQEQTETVTPIYSKEPTTIRIKLDDFRYTNFIETIENYDYNYNITDFYNGRMYTFDISEYYYLENALTHYKNTKENEANHNVIASGVCRKYNINDEKKIPVDSLWYDWALNASIALKKQNAESNDYQTQISYIQSFNLSSIFNLANETQTLESAILQSDLDSIFKTLNLTTEKEQEDFLKFMYSTELTQTNPQEFWDNYNANSIEQADSAAVQFTFRRQIRKHAVKYMSKRFYSNMMDAIRNNTITDLNTVFYFMKAWEIDCYNHIQYSNSSPIDDIEFVEWQRSIHTAIFQTLGESNNIDPSEISDLYNNYEARIKVNGETQENCNLSNFNNYSKKYIADIVSKQPTDETKPINALVEQMTGKSK